MYDVAKHEVIRNKKLLQDYQNTMNKLKNIKQNSLLEDEAFKFYMVSRESKLHNIYNERLLEKQKVSDSLQKKSLSSQEYEKMRQNAHSSLGRSSLKIKTDYDSLHGINQHSKNDDSLEIKDRNPILDRLSNNYIEV